MIKTLSSILVFFALPYSSIISAEKNEYNLTPLKQVKLVSEEKYVYFTRDIVGGLLVDPEKQPYNHYKKIASPEMVASDYLKAFILWEKDALLSVVFDEKKKTIQSKAYATMKQLPRNGEGGLSNYLFSLDKRVDFGRGRKSTVLICYRILSSNLKEIVIKDAVMLKYKKGKWLIDDERGNIIYKEIRKKDIC